MKVALTAGEQRVEPIPRRRAHLPACTCRICGAQPKQPRTVQPGSSRPLTRLLRFFLNARPMLFRSHLTSIRVRQTWNSRRRHRCAPGLPTASTPAHSLTVTLVPCARKVFAAQRCPRCAAAGDGYTYDGCYGMYTVIHARALLPCSWRESAKNRLGPASGRPTAACVGRAPPHYIYLRQPALSVQVLSSTEYLLPNKNGGNWDNPTDTFNVSQLVAARQGLTFTWGPQEFCANTTEGKCDYNDSTILNQTWCEAKYGPLAAPLATYVYGGGGDPVCTRGSLSPL